MLWSLASSATTYEVTPENYRARLGKLRPGDQMRLQPGHYRRGMPVHGLHGTPGRWIEIVGSDDNKSILVARSGHNTISLVD